jgi:hypothetical protein
VRAVTVTGITRSSPQTDLRAFPTWRLTSIFARRGRV